MTPKERRRQELNDLRHLLADPAFRQWLPRELGKLHMDASAYASDAVLMAYNIAQHDHGKWLIAECKEADAKAVAKMEHEELERQRAEERERSTEREDDTSE